GTGSFWNAAQAAALNAPCAVAWLTDASPKEQSTIESGPKGDRRPSRVDRSMATAMPTALGRCEAMVLVCGGMARGTPPNTLWRPPEMGSSAEEVRERGK